MLCDLKPCCIFLAILVLAPSAICGDDDSGSCSAGSGSDAAACPNPASSQPKVSDAVARMRAVLQGEPMEELPDGPPELVAARSALHAAFRGLSGVLSEQDGPKKDGATYGELTDSGATTAFAWLNLTSDDVFCDCGSGIGRLVLQAALETPVKRAIGVEFVASRHASAGIALERLLAKGFSLDDRVEFVHGDLKLWPNLTKVGGCNKIFMNSLAFPDGLKHEVVQRLLGHEALAAGARSSGPVLIVSTARLTTAKQPDSASALPRLVQLSAGSLAASWDRVSSYLYEVRLDTL